ncbi:MAG TPA: Ig-like domain-containing protein, partial [Gemmatimonadales bacterium]|nr:Ig-like domain-containing protein [Gemmatimonadales bacterium]
MRVGAGFCLALFIVTCTDKNVVGPRASGTAALDLRAFASPAQPGMPNIPLDSVRVLIQRLPGLDTAADKVFSLHATTADSLKVDLTVSLNTDPESFVVTVSAYGGNAIWYVATDTTSISSKGPATPILGARYVGPGAGATSVTLAPRDTTIVGGQAVTLRITVDSGVVPLANVPVGLLSGDTTKGKISQPTATGGVFTGATGIRDSVWMYVETPTHLRDSTRIHIVPPPSQLKKISGDSQVVIVNGTAAAPLTVRVEDALNGGSPGVPVTWTVTQGTATLAPPSPVVSDTGGNASVTVTPSSLGTVKVQAASTGLNGSPITFTVNVLAGLVHQVIVTPKLDTLARSASFQFTATLKDSLGNVISSVKPVWTSSNTAVATVDSTGLASGLAGDSTYIIAAAGGHADTARLFVRVPAKVVLSPSDTVVTSIGDSVHLAGVVLTNFGDTVKTATVIRFASTVPSVVTVNAATGEATLVGAGNGVVQATDTISKVTGTATLRVNQKVFSIVNTPPDSIEVGVSGQAQILASAKDKNGHPIPGKVFGWVSRNPGIATVNQSGVVTGVAIGAGPTYAVDTLVDSVTVFRDSTLVSVVSSPPPVMRWAFDTLAIGNGGNTTVNVSLNVPSAAGTVMQILSGDTTKVKPTQTRIVIGTGGASASVTLQGLAATLTPVDVIAQDSAGIYKPDTIRVIVVSTIFFAQVGQTTRTQDFYLNQNETLNGQVFLSDPAPAGGLGVTFVYAKGFSTTNPTTVVIPAGQLAAPIQFLGVGAGTDSVIPSSGAFAGKFSYLHVAKDTFQIGQPYPYTGVVGLGQTETPYAQIPNAMDHILPFTLAVTPAIATVSPNPDTIPVNNGNRSFTVRGTSVGTATITVSAPNWLSSTVPLIVTPPQLIAGGSLSMVAGTPSLGSWNTYSGDTTRYNHPVVAPLTVHIASRDTTVVKVLSDSLVIVATQSFNSVSNALFAQPGAGGDSTWLVETAPGYKPDSFLVHVTKPTMTASYNYPYDGRVALNTTFPQPVYVQIPYARTDTFALVLHHTNKSGPQAPDTLFIPKGQAIG